MKRWYILLLATGCSGGEFAPAVAEGGRASVEPEAGRSMVAKGGEDGGGRASTGGSAPTAGKPPASAGENAGGSSTSDAGTGSGGDAGSHLGGTSAGDGGSSAGSGSGGAGGSDGGSSGASGSGGAGGSSSGSGGTGGFSVCPREAQMVWKVNGSSCTCDLQCNRTKAQCAGMEGKSCMNPVSCMPDCNKPTPDSCGAAETWHESNGVCACGDCVKNLTGCKLGNQCLVSVDGMTCKEAC